MPIWVWVPAVKFKICRNLTTPIGIKHGLARASSFLMPQDFTRSCQLSLQNTFTSSLLQSTAQGHTISGVTSLLASASILDSYNLFSTHRQDYCFLKHTSMMSETSLNLPSGFPSCSSPLPMRLQPHWTRGCSSVLCCFLCLECCSSLSVLDSFLYGIEVSISVLGDTFPDYQV